MILETKKISKAFGKLQALYKVNLAVKPGEIFGIAGPNGAGKSTLFNVMAGTFPPSDGQVVFYVHDVTKLSANRTCRLGLARTFQIPHTFPTLTVFDNVRVGATFGDPHDKNPRGKVRETLEFLSLLPFIDTPASNLDLYTTKLVMMAASLATGCKLLMLDEPLAGLSITEINDFLDVVRKVNQEGQTTILMIEHILDSLIEISDRLLILHNGEVIYTGAPEGVRRDRQVVEVYLGEGGGAS